MATYSANVSGNQECNGLFHSIGAVFVTAENVADAKRRFREHGAKRGLKEGTVQVTCLSLEWDGPDQE